MSLFNKPLSYLIDIKNSVSLITINILLKFSKKKIIRNKEWMRFILCRKQYIHI